MKWRQRHGLAIAIGHVCRKSWVIHELLKSLRTLVKSHSLKASRNLNEVDQNGDMYFCSEWQYCYISYLRLVVWPLWRRYYWFLSSVYVGILTACVVAHRNRYRQHLFMRYSKDRRWHEKGRGVDLNRAFSFIIVVHYLVLKAGRSYPVSSIALQCLHTQKLSLLLPFINVRPFTLY